MTFPLNSRFRIAAAALAILTVAALATPRDARAFCGFFVGKAGAKLYNHASQVVMVRHDDKTVISLMNDYQGPLDEFALVVPVPEVLQRGQIHIGDRAIFEKLDAYSAPRLVEYHDPDPCRIFEPMRMQMGAAGAPAEMNAAKAESSKALGVTVEAQYTVGEYDIVILSAKQSDGLEAWLVRNGYQIPQGARAALAPYIRQDMKFFVAKVNLKEQKRTGLSYLRPLQFAFTTRKFMLPIRLGMINADGPQDLIIYALTRDGRVETTNYRTVRLPTGDEIPNFVRDEFPKFYQAMFNEQVRRNEMRAVFTEYVWNMGWCDPCAGPPLSRDELRQLGVFWLDQGGQPVPQLRFRPAPMPFQYGGATPVILTRLHVRYSADTFPEDLAFQETADRENWQARYVLHVPWDGSPDACPAARSYFDRLEEQRSREAQNLAELTGWDLDAIMKRAGATTQPAQWWSHLWE
jgi:hypothetical protein